MTFSQALVLAFATAFTVQSALSRPWRTRQDVATRAAEAVLFGMLGACIAAVLP